MEVLIGGGKIDVGESKDYLYIFLSRMEEILSSICLLGPLIPFVSIVSISVLTAHSYTLYPTLKLISLLRDFYLVMHPEIAFPHLTDTGPAPSHHQVVARYEEVFAAFASEGILRPPVLPYCLYGIALLFVYLCIPHTQSQTLYAARWPVLLAIISFQLKVLSETGSGNVGVAALTGVTSGFIIILAMTWLVWLKPQFNAKRVQKRKKHTIQAETEKVVLEGNGSILLRDQLQENDSGTLTIIEMQEKAPYFCVAQDIKQRRGQYGISSKKLTLSNTTPRERGSEERNRPGSSTEEEAEFEYFWETYPHTLRERIPWVIDLLSNTRGIGWNWAISTIPDLPDYIKEQLGEPVSPKSPKRTSNRIFSTTGAVIRYRLPQAVICYVLFDALKTIQMRDPYFLFGPSTYELPGFLRKLPPALVFSFRYFVCCTIGFTLPLQFLFVLEDLAVCFAGPRILGVVAEPWHLPTTWGSATDVFDKGLRGFWGNLWHQRLRNFFSAPTAFLIERGYLAPKSLAANWTGLFIAFAVSGFMHACICVTQFQRSQPLRNFVFFMLQGVGIILQTSFCAFFRPWLDRIPKLIRQIGNFFLTFLWCAITGPLYADDIAIGGAWLNEPVPISLFRGLGLGEEGDGWWCWNMYIRGSWYWGKHWWDSGLAI